MRPYSSPRPTLALSCVRVSHTSAPAQPEDVQRTSHGPRSSKARNADSTIESVVPQTHTGSRRSPEVMREAAARPGDTVDLGPGPLNPLGIARTCAFFLGEDHRGAFWIISRKNTRTTSKNARGMDVRAMARSLVSEGFQDRHSREHMKT